MSSSYPIWHPYTQMQTAGPPINIVSGKGACLYDDKGNEYIDAVASWWTNIHGHAHPHIAAGIAAQAKQLEHVIFAGFAHPPAIQLAEKLLTLIPYHQKVFYSDNGSTAVEVAIKMALQYWANRGQARYKIIAFKDAYHGDTFGAMSVSARGVFTAAFQQLLFEVAFIDTPVAGREEITVQQLNNHLNQGDVAAFIFEPLVLGSAGMLMYSPQVLDTLMQHCKLAGVLCIADEVMTGFGRSGKMFATEHCSQQPDIICMSKGITGGFLPFAATTCTQQIYDAFLSDDKAKMFFHGHSYTGNPLGCAAALASLEVFEADQTLHKIAAIEKMHSNFATQLRLNSKVESVRQTGTILAMDIKVNEGAGYLNAIRDRAYNFFIQRKVILRPLGNTLYVLPPYCITHAQLTAVYGVITDFLNTL